MRRRLISTVAAVICLGFVGVPVASGAGRGDPVQERDQLRATQAEMAARLDVMHADLAKIEAGFQALDANVATQQDLLGRADQELTQATTDDDAASAAVDRATGRLAELDGQRIRQAVAAYVRPPVDDMFRLFRMQDVNEANSRQVFADIQSEIGADLSDRLSGAQKDLAAVKRRAARAHRTAKAKHAMQQAQADKVIQARAQQAVFADAVKQRIDESLAVSIQLAQTDRQLSTQIAMEQAALAARVAAVKAAADDAAVQRMVAALGANTQASERARLANELIAFQLRRTQGGRVPLTEGVVSTNPGEAPTVGSGGIRLTTVGGFTVNVLIADPLAAMIAAARVDGVDLTGGGYRDPAQQIILRQAHCGTSYEAVYLMPAGDCRPPTAPPGMSMHEIGLAIDFDACDTHTTACYLWLSTHAAAFGLINLASEPWHWSVTGS